MRATSAILLSLAFALPAVGQSSKDTYTRARIPPTQQDAARRDPVLSYVEANVAETLYHELAHALIDAIDLPIYGPEEYAADMFAVVMMNRLHSDGEIMQMAPLIAANYLWFADRSGQTVGDLDLWDVHGPDLQRYYNFSCMVYGSGPDTRRDILQLSSLPEERVETCKDEYEQTARAWGIVLDAHATSTPGNSLRMDWVAEPESHLARFVTSVVDEVNATIQLPATINVSVIPCGQSNAYYDPDYAEIQICTELANDLASRARELR
ncbi:DUF4344 domain-containing metallopeptidase [Maritimibacter dapengensis]|uniref:DUF4344 domain-containing metallopeptidase n=1 Tax=Maritimibacter dapengensis TaxID=2836868 RepID=A0ABS6SY86_9RHOB|nr:DUF4344 domain-containing metallopeptidase [Maritimibacter dapengensis]MBV7377700.1 DUF4344 domain-containing metallopeptidase [Maritimibacter dapengensis]